MFEQWEDAGKNLGATEEERIKIAQQLPFFISAIVIVIYIYTLLFIVGFSISYWQILGIIFSIIPFYLQTFDLQKKWAITKRFSCF